MGKHFISIQVHFILTTKHMITKSFITQKEKNFMTLKINTTITDYIEYEPKCLINEEIKQTYSIWAYLIPYVWMIKIFVKIHFFFTIDQSKVT